MNYTIGHNIFAVVYLKPSWNVEIASCQCRIVSGYYPILKNDGRSRLSPGHLKNHAIRKCFSYVSFRSALSKTAQYNHSCWVTRGSSVVEWSKAPIFVSRLLASHRYGHRFESRSFRKSHVRKVPVTCGGAVVLLSQNYSEVFLHQ